jgi:hypothetical protein
MPVPPVVVGILNMAEGTNSKMNIAIIHPDLGIGNNLCPQLFSIPFKQKSIIWVGFPLCFLQCSSLYYFKYQIPIVDSHDLVILL